MTHFAHFPVLKMMLYDSYVINIWNGLVKSISISFVKCILCDNINKIKCVLYGTPICIFKLITSSGVQMLLKTLATSSQLCNLLFYWTAALIPIIIPLKQLMPVSSMWPIVPCMSSKLCTSANVKKLANWYKPQNSAFPSCGPMALCLSA